MTKSCETCLHSYSNDEGLKLECNLGLCVGCVPCPKWKEDRMHVVNQHPPVKPPLGCSPYYVSAAARICELCEAIKRCSTEPGKHNQIKLWAAEIQYLNEMDRMLRRVEEEKTWVEEKDGTLKEVE